MTIKEYNLEKEIKHLTAMSRAINNALPLLLDCTKTDADAVFLMQQRQKLTLITQQLNMAKASLDLYKSKK